MAAKYAKNRRYNAAHYRLRRMWRGLVEAGAVACARCGGRIEPGTPWDLGHHDIYRDRHTGPEHAKCNRGAPHKLVHSRQW